MITSFVVVTDEEGKFLAALRHENLVQRSLGMTYSSCKDVKIEKLPGCFRVTATRPATKELEERKSVDLYFVKTITAEVLDEPEHF